MKQKQKIKSEPKIKITTVNTLRKDLIRMLSRLGFVNLLKVNLSRIRFLMEILQGNNAARK